MSLTYVLAVYAGLCALAALAGGWVPLFMRLTHRWMEVAISFVAGVILGVGLLNLLPHAFEELQSISQTASWIMGGFLLMFFLERFLQFHHHDAPDAPDEHSERPAEMACMAAAHQHQAGDKSVEIPQFSWGGVAFGLTLHGTIDGIALAAAASAERSLTTTSWVGIGTLLAIVLHKPFDSLTIGTLMAAADCPRLWRHVVNVLYALVTPGGMLLFYFGAQRYSGDHRLVLGGALGFASGAFLCIAASDLLPEVQFHRHDRVMLSLALLAGIALAWSVIYFEGDGHTHHDRTEARAELNGNLPAAVTAAAVHSPATSSWLNVSRISRFSSASCRSST